MAKSKPNRKKPFGDSNDSTDERANELADKWIKELSDAGFTHDDMIALFREARRKFEDYKSRKNQKQFKKH
jgi:hypothetical protein